MDVDPVRESTRMAGSDTVQVQPTRCAVAVPAEEEACLDQSLSLDRFLAGVERRAFRIAEMAVRDRDDALDIVQMAMLRLARNYAERPSEEWKPLFYRILYNGIRDWQRRRSVRSRIFGYLPGTRRDGEDEQDDPFEHVPDGGPDPSRRVMADEALEKLEQALGALPERQREAFTLRCLEGMDVAETAVAMGCSEGSVKTHYFRALHTLREKLGEVW